MTAMRSSSLTSNSQSLLPYFALQAKIIIPSWVLPGGALSDEQWLSPGSHSLPHYIFFHSLTDSRRFPLLNTWCFSLFFISWMKQIKTNITKFLTPQVFTSVQICSFKVPFCTGFFLYRVTKAKCDTSGIFGLPNTRESLNGCCVLTKVPPDCINGQSRGKVANARYFLS